MSKSLPDAEYVRARLSYCPATGVLTWLARTPDMFTQTRTRSAEHNCNNWNSQYAGTVAGSIKQDRILIRIGGRFHFAHRLAFLIVTGRWPENYIDHVNGYPLDNRWKNLREATPAENQQNRSEVSGSSSGYMGVSWDRSRSKWQAHIKIDGKFLHLGRFVNIEDAVIARREAKVSLHTFSPVARVA